MRVPKFFFLTSILLVAGGWLWAYFALRNITQPLVLHWSDYTGIDAIASLRFLHGVGFLGILGVSLNFVLAAHLERRDPFLRGLLAAATLFLAILLFIGFAAIISVNS